MTPLSGSKGHSHGTTIIKLKQIRPKTYVMYTIPHRIFSSKELKQIPFLKGLLVQGTNHRSCFRSKTLRMYSIVLTT